MHHHAFTKIELYLARVTSKSIEAIIVNFWAVTLKEKTWQIVSKV